MSGLAYRGRIAASRRRSVALPSVNQRIENANAGVFWSQSDIAAPWVAVSDNALFNPTITLIDENLNQTIVSGTVKQWPAQTETDADGSWSERMTDGTFSDIRMVWSDEAAELKMTGSAESVDVYRQAGADEGTMGNMHASGAGGYFQYFSSINGVPLSSLVGQEITFECDIKITAIGGDTVLADSRLRFYAENSSTQNIPWSTVTVGEAVGNNIAGSFTLADGGTALRTDNGGLGVWQRLRVTGLIPTGTVRMRILPEARPYLSGHTFVNAPTVTFRVRRARVALGSSAAWTPPTTTNGSTLLMAVAVRGATASVISDPDGWTLQSTVTSSAGSGVSLKVYKIENAAARTGIERVTLTGAVEAAMTLVEVLNGGNASLEATHNNSNSTSTTQRTGASAALSETKAMVGFIAYPNNGTDTATSTQDDTDRIVSQHLTANQRITLRRYDRVIDTGAIEFTQTTGGAVPYAGAIIGVTGG